jgi:hypothetical protein
MANPHTDLLLQGAQQPLTRRLTDVPKIETSPFNGRDRFNWKPTALVVAAVAIGLVAFAYL